MEISEKDLDSMFMQYLDIALGEFEQPHSMTDTERLDVYRRAFKKVIRDKFKELSECQE